MALSDYATMAFDRDGNSSNGSFKSFSGIEAEIYKNWIYLRSEHMWREDGGYSKPTIAQVNEGAFILMDLEVKVVRRSLQNAVFVFAFSSYYKDDEFTSDWMVGIGCYGHVQSKWMGVTPALAEKFFLWLESTLDDRSFSGRPTKDWARKLRESQELIETQGRHFNQGDAFFEAAGFGDKPMLPPGQAQEPVITQFINGMKGE